MFAQFTVLLFAIVLAGVKSLVFEPNTLTDFELKRQADSGDEAAKLEQRLRHDRLPLQGLQRWIVLLLTIVIIFILVGSFKVINGVFFVFVWLLVVEWVSLQSWMIKFAEKIFVSYAQIIFGMAEMLKPSLKILAGKRMVATGRIFGSKEELKKLIKADKTALSSEEKKFMLQVLSYESQIAKDIMTPRSEIVTVDAGETMGPLLLDTLHKSGKKHFLVIDKKLDNAVGVLAMVDVMQLNPDLKKVGDARLGRISYVKQDQPLEHLLNAFLRTDQHLFIVINKSEEIVGVVTIEDLLEFIFGRKIAAEFNQYEDRHAVAQLANARDSVQNSSKTSKSN